MICCNFKVELVSFCGGFWRNFLFWVYWVELLDFWANWKLIQKLRRESFTISFGHFKISWATHQKNCIIKVNFNRDFPKIKQETHLHPIFLTFLCQFVKLKTKCTWKKNHKKKLLNFLVILLPFLVDFGLSLKCNNATIGITKVLTKLLGEALEVTVKIFVRAFENANQEKVFQEISSYLWKDFVT